MGNCGFFSSETSGGVAGSQTAVASALGLMETERRCMLVVGFKHCLPAPTVAHHYHGNPLYVQL